LILLGLKNMAALEIRLESGPQMEAKAAEARAALNEANLDTLESFTVHGYGGSEFPTSETIGWIKKMKGLKRLHFFSLLVDAKAIEMITDALKPEFKPLLEEILLKGDVQGEYTLEGFVDMCATLSSLPNLKKLSLLDMSKYTTESRRYNSWNGDSLLDLVRSCASLKELNPPSALSPGFPTRLFELLLENYVYHTSSGCEDTADSCDNVARQITLEKLHLDDVRQQDIPTIEKYFSTANGKTTLKTVVLYGQRVDEESQSRLTKISGGVVQFNVPYAF